MRRRTATPVGQTFLRGLRTILEDLRDLEALAQEQDEPLTSNQKQKFSDALMDLSTLHADLTMEEGNPRTARRCTAGGLGEGETYWLEVTNVSGVGHNDDDLSDLAEYILEYEVEGPIERWIKDGIEFPDETVALYVGDEEGYFVRSLDDQEKATVERVVERG
jgi:hypothetical protein